MGLLILDLVRRWKWYLFVVCVYVVWLLNAHDMAGEPDVEVGIAFNGMFMCLVVFGIMEAESQMSTLRVMKTLPVSRARLAALEWGKFVLLPPLLAAVSGLCQFYAWEASDPLPLLKVYALAIIGLGTLLAALTWFLELQSRTFALLGVWGGLRLLVCSVAALVVIAVIVGVAVTQVSYSDVLRPIELPTIAAGVAFSVVSWLRRDWLLHARSAGWRIHIRGFVRPRRSTTLRYTRLPWVRPYVRQAVLPAAILAPVVLVLAGLSRPGLSFLQEDGRIIRYCVAVLAIFVLPFIGPDRPFPLKAYRTLPLSSLGLTLRLAAYYAMSTASTLLVVSPLLVPQPGGVVFLAALVLVACGMAIASAGIRSSVPRVFQIPLVLLAVAALAHRHPHWIETVIGRGEAGVEHVALGAALTGLSIWVVYRVVTRSSVACREEERVRQEEGV